MNLSLALRRATQEVLDVVFEESKRVYLEKKKDTPTTGMLLASFTKEPVKHGGTLVYSGVMYAGGPSAPYAIYVDQSGWKTVDGGHKEGYGFMAAGIEKGAKMSREITLKHLKLVAGN